MKLERECDIPAMRGQTRAARIALNRQARTVDRWIFWLDGISAVLCVAILAVADWLEPRLQWREWLFAGLVFATAYVILMTFKAAFVTPRIRKALALVPMAPHPGEAYAKSAQNEY